jgi:hypothetical protein
MQCTVQVVVCESAIFKNWNVYCNRCTTRGRMGDFKVGVNTGVLCTFCTVNTGVKTNQIWDHPLSPRESVRGTELWFYCNVRFKLRSLVSIVMHRNPSWNNRGRTLVPGDFIRCYTPGPNNLSESRWMNQLTTARSSTVLVGGWYRWSVKSGNCLWVWSRTPEYLKNRQVRSTKSEKHLLPGPINLWSSKAK